MNSQTFRRIQIQRTGPAQVMELNNVEFEPLNPDEVRVRLTRIGINFSEINFRWGRYGFAPAQFPYTPGIEGVGRIEAIGSEVDGLTIGDRVVMAAGGANQMYSEAVQVKATTIVPLPDTISDEVAAAIALKGLMARSLLLDVRRVAPGDTVLVHGATGGVSIILAQWAKHLGATVIGTVGHRSKVAAASAAGCETVLVREDGHFIEALNRVTDNKGVAVVCDPLGAETIQESFLALQRRGTVVSYGNTSGIVKAVDPLWLTRSSLYFTRPMLHDFITNNDQRRASAAELFGLVEAGIIKPAIAEVMPLARVVQAHELVETRRAIGAVVLAT